MESRIGATLTLYAFAALGLFLLVSPWTAVGAQASYALLPELIGKWVLSGWVRGTVSGLGALDLLVAARIVGDLTQEKKGGA